MYVVWGCEHLRDGREESANIVASMEEALATINGYGGRNSEFKVFELGKEVPLVKKIVEDKEVKVTKKTMYGVA